MAEIPFNIASIGPTELEAVRRSLLSGHISGAGPYTVEAEKILGEFHDGSRVLMTTSCTHALEMAATLLDLQPGDEVIVPAFTFVSTALAFLMSGAIPVLVDVRDDTLNLDESLVEAAITPRTRAICVVNYGGLAAELETLQEIAEANQLALVEDNAHGLGGKYKGRVLGTFGKMSALSFHETKNLTSGEGGAIVLNDEALVERAEIIREKGTNRSRFFRGLVDKYTWADKGSSWLPSDILAALLTAQLRRFDQIQSKRHSIWNRYRTELHGWSESRGYRLPLEAEDAPHTAHLFHLRLKSLNERQAFIEHLANEGIKAVFHYQSLNRSEMGARLGYDVNDFPVSIDAADTLVRLPLYEGLTDDQVTHIVDTVRLF